MVRVKLLLAAVLCLIPQDTADIPPEDRVPNATRVQCVWVSLETLARWNNIKSLYTLSQTHRGLAGPADVRQVLQKRKVYFYDAMPPNNKESYDLIHWANSYDICCLVGLNRSHAVVLQDIDDEHVTIVENKRQGCPTIKIPRETFDRIFDGWVVTIFIPKEPQNVR
jgi:hypothetical protein